MRWLARCIASVSLAVALVVSGFAAGASQGAHARYMVEDAYAVGEVQAARAFATILGSMGFSVGAYALKNSTSFDSAADNLYVDFNNSTVDDAFKGLVTSAVSALVASPAGVAFANLGLTVDALKCIAQWMLDDGLLDPSSVTYPDVSFTYSNVDYSYSVADLSSFSFSRNGVLYRYGIYRPTFHDYLFLADGVTIESFYVSQPYNRIGIVLSIPDTLPQTSQGQNIYAYSSSYLSPTDSQLFIQSATTSVGFLNVNGSISSYLAYLFDSSYKLSGVGVTAPADTVVSGAPANIGSSSIAADAQAFADAVSANLADKTLVANGTTVNNYTYGDIVTDGTVTPPADNILDWLQENLGALQGTLEGVLEGIQAGTIEIVDAVTAVPSAVMEGITTFFDPVVKLFSPPDLSDDDIGDMIKSNASGDHTFTQHFPFCVLNDYMSAFNTLAVEQKSRAALNYTPQRFVIVIPAAGYSGGKDVKMDFTHYFTDEFYGLTIGRFVQIVLSVCTFVGVLGFVARLVGIADLPTSFYVNQNGESVAVYEDGDGQTRLF